MYLFIHLFLERRREGEREGEKHQCVVASCTPPTGDLAQNPDMCPRLEIEPETLWCLQVSAQSTEPHQPRAIICIFNYIYIFIDDQYKNSNLSRNIEATAQVLIPEDK